MAQKKLTDTVIRNLPHPDSGSVKYWDTSTAGFGVRVTAKSRSFIVMFGQDRRLKTLGKYPNISLSDARKEAKQYLVLKPDIKRSQLISEALQDYLTECHVKEIGHLPLKHTHAYYL